jgi:biotin transporter BioY
MKRLTAASLILFLVLASAGVPWAQGGLKAGMDSPIQVVTPPDVLRPRSSATR